MEDKILMVSMSSRVITRGYLIVRDDTPVVEVSLDNMPSEINVENKIYAMAISTPYGCVVGIGFIVKSLDINYLTLSLSNPLDHRDVEAIKKILETKKVAIKVRALDSEFEYIHDLSEDDSYRVEYVMNKTKECDLSMNRSIDLDKAFNWIVESFS